MLASPDAEMHVHLSPDAVRFELFPGSRSLRLPAACRPGGKERRGLRPSRAGLLLALLLLPAAQLCAAPAALALNLLVVPEVALTQGFTDRSRFTSVQQAAPEYYATLAPALGAVLGLEQLQLDGRGQASATYRTATGEALFGGGQVGLGWTISERAGLTVGYRGSLGEQVAPIVDGARAEGGTATTRPPRTGPPLITAATQTEELVVLTHSAALALRFALTERLAFVTSVDGVYRQQTPLDGASSFAAEDYAGSGAAGLSYALSGQATLDLGYGGGTFLDQRRDQTSIFHGGSAGLRYVFSDRCEVSANGGLRVAMTTTAPDTLYVPVGGVAATYRWPRTSLNATLDRAFVLDATLGGTTLSYIFVLAARHQLMPQLDLGLGFNSSWAELARLGDDPEFAEGGYLDYGLEVTGVWHWTRNYRLEGRFARYFTLPLDQPDYANSQQGNAFELLFGARWD